MRKPTIDDLLKQVDSIYELTMLAAREAKRIRLKDKDAKEPLQKALERIAEGKVRGQYLSPKEMAEYEKNEKERRETAAMRDRHVIPPSSGRGDKR
jgi:DNA-directed RNA polymerase omega subunit